MKNFQMDNITGQNSAGPTPNEPLRRLTATSIIGDKIFNTAGESLGKITDIMIDVTDGTVDYLVIQFGGFLGMNPKYFAVPMQALTPAREHENAFILNETKQSLKEYPGFDKDHWPKTNAKPTDGNDSASGFMNERTKD